MKEKELRKIARQKIREGKNSQQAFEEIVSEFPSEKVLGIADIVKEIPTLKTRRKLKKWTNLFICLFSATFGYAIFLKFSSFIENKDSYWDFFFLILLTIFLAFLIWGTLTYYRHAYQVAAGMTFVYSNILWDSLLSKDFSFSPFIWFVIAGIILIGGFIFHRKLTSNYTVEKEEYVNEEGFTRLKNRIIFND